MVSPPSHAAGSLSGDARTRRRVAGQDAEARQTGPGPVGNGRFALVHLYGTCAIACLPPLAAPYRRYFSNYSRSARRRRVFMASLQQVGVLNYVHVYVTVVYIYIY